VHRKPTVSEPLLRLWRSLGQNVFAAAVTAGGAAIINAGPDVGDPQTLVMIGGQAAIAAMLAYVYAKLRPNTGGRIPEAPVRAGRSWLQNLLAGVIVAVASAVAGAEVTDLATLGVLAVEAAVAAVIAYVYNLVAPLPRDALAGD